ncbi:MAG: hypothetical protein OEQ14_19230 [Gammaproteobacteria bacterium]|nr:hypothetical protein [Gammaproteobacteria bacterium]
MWRTVCTMTLLSILAQAAHAENPAKLSEETFRQALGQQGFIILEVNWGRHWNCGEYENVQLQRLTFSRFEEGAVITNLPSLDLKTPSKLFVKDEFTPYALAVEPGTWALTGFDVKTARPGLDVGHAIGNADNLIAQGKPVGGTFTIAAGEIIYLGHFSRDCDQGPIPWRYYLTDREDFVRYVARFREWYPFAAGIAVEYRLFATENLGRQFALENPVVPGVAVSE